MINEFIVIYISELQFCANWDGFHDPHSGIADYYWSVGSVAGSRDIMDWSVGSVAGSRDVMDWFPLHNSVQSHCVERCLQLKHNTKYFSTVMALHGGHKRLNVTAISTGSTYQHFTTFSNSPSIG